MDMTVSEIECAYRQAKKKAEQIGILADRNCCTKDEIMNILIDIGKYKKRGNFLYSVEYTEKKDSTEKKTSAEKKMSTKEQATIDVKTAIEVIANEIKRHRATIAESNKQLEDLQAILTGMFQQ